MDASSQGAPAGRPPSSEGPRDETLPVLSVDQARELTRIARQAFAEHGAEVLDEGGRFRTADGTVHGLHNLAVAAYRAPYERWPQMARTFAAALLGPGPSAEELAAAPVLVQLRERADLPTQPLYEAREALPGLVAVLASDLPDRVVEHLGPVTVRPSAQEAYAEAEERLRAMPLPQRSVQRVDEAAPGTEVTVLEGRDFFVASRLLLLPELVEQATGMPIGRAGVLVIAPSRHVVLLHHVTGAHVLPVAQAMLAMAQAAVRREAGPVSADLFHVMPDGRAERVGSRGEGGEPSLDATGTLGEALALLGLLGRPGEAER